MPPNPWPLSQALGGFKGLKCSGFLYNKTTPPLKQLQQQNKLNTYNKYFPTLTNFCFLWDPTVINDLCLQSRTNLSHREVSHSLKLLPANSAWSGLYQARIWCSGVTQMFTCSCTASYSGLPASWACIYQEIFLVIISFKKRSGSSEF